MLDVFFTLTSFLISSIIIAFIIHYLSFNLYDLRNENISWRKFMYQCWQTNVDMCQMRKSEELLNKTIWSYDLFSTKWLNDKKQALRYMIQ